jgi:methylamine dehydrogenase accessory protein MauD
MSGWWLASFLALWALMIVTLTVLLVVLRQLGLIYLRTQGGGLTLDEGPALGAVVSPFDELDDEGREVRFPSADAELNVLLFASPGCSICKDALRGVSVVRRDYDAHVVVLSQGDQSENDELKKVLDGSAPFVTSLRRQKAMGVESIPFGIATNRTGVVLDKRVINNVVDLEELLESAEKASVDAPQAVPA